MAKMKILNYDDIPKMKNGNILWRKIEKGFKFVTVHDDYGYNEFEFVDMKKNNKMILIVDNKSKEINASIFLKGNIGGILGIISSDFKIEIGQTFKDDKRDLIITDREHRKINGVNQKWYKYTCSKCGWTEGWNIEYNLFKGNGCLCCANQISVLGINTIWDTDRWMCDLGLSEEDAKTHTKGSNDKVKVVCPHCCNKKEMTIKQIYNENSIGCRECGNGMTYPEKFMTNILNQLNIKFTTQYSTEWSNRKIYDFYLPKYNMIIETHGIQHYEESPRGRTLKEEQANDELKYELALKNNIDEYIVIDCRYSDFEWIKNSILNSELNNMFDLSNIDWLKCEKSSLPNLIKEVCDYWNQKEDWETAQTIADNNPWGIKAKTTIIDYLKKGTKLGWTNYDPKEEMRRTNVIKNKKRKYKYKPINVYKDDVLIMNQQTCLKIVKELREAYNIRIGASTIYKLCDNSNIYKHLRFEYVNVDTRGGDEN